MDYKRAVLAALLTYAVTFIFGLLAALLGFGFEDAAGTISANTWIFGGVTAVAATVLGAWWYFKKKGVRATINTGFHLGLVIIVVSFVLDLLAFLPALSDPEMMALLTAYYGNPLFWVIVVLVIVTASLTGKYYDKYFAKPGKKSK